MSNEQAPSGVAEIPAPQAEEQAPSTDQNLDTQAAAQEAVKAESKEDRQWASKFAALTRKEKSIREREKKIEAQLRELQAKSVPATAEQKPQESLELRLRKDPFNTLKELGIGYDTLTQMALNEGKLTPEVQMQLLKEEMQTGYKTELQKLQERLDKRERDDAEAREQQAIRSFKSTLANEISTNKDMYELLAAEGESGIDAVYDLVDEIYKDKIEAGEEADIEEIKKLALDAVEDELLEEAKKRIELGKIKKLLEPSQDKVPAKPQTIPKPASVTLSNQISQVQTGASKQLSKEEAIREAAKLIKFTP